MAMCKCCLQTGVWRHTKCNSVLTLLETRLKVRKKTLQVLKNSIKLPRFWA